MSTLLEKTSETPGEAGKTERQFRTASNNVDSNDGRDFVGGERNYEPDEETLSKDAQAGVQKMQAATTVWSKWHLITAYGL